MNIKIVIIIPSFCILTFMQSCSSFKTVEKNIRYEEGIMITEEKKIKLRTHCFSKEISTKVDTTTNQTIYKEIKTYDCKGAYSFPIKMQVWSLRNGRLKKMKSNN